MHFLTPRISKVSYFGHLASYSIFDSKLVQMKNIGHYYKLPNKRTCKILDGPSNDLKNGFK